MKQALYGALATLIAGAVAAAAFLWSGLVDVAADTPHTPAVYRLLELARERSIARRLDDISVPADLADAERQRRGVGNYDAMCADCHLKPGVSDSEIRRGLYPQPPDLTRPAKSTDPERAAARSFWIVRHGIKASGMPAWSRGGVEDAAIWDMVAFLQRLPTLSPAQYGELVAASDGHAHGGADGAEAMHGEEPAPPAKARHVHDPSDGHTH